MLATMFVATSAPGVQSMENVRSARPMRRKVSTARIESVIVVSCRLHIEFVNCKSVETPPAHGTNLADRRRGKCHIVVARADHG